MMLPDLQLVTCYRLRVKHSHFVDQGTGPVVESAAKGQHRRPRPSTVWLHIGQPLRTFTSTSTAVCSAVAAGTLLAAAVVTPASARTTPAVPEDLRVMSDGGYAQLFGADRAEAEGLTVDSPQVIPASPHADVAVQVSHWSVVKFVSKDGEGKNIPTREGNRKFGWRHFSGPHNIHDPKVIKIVTSERPEEKEGARRVYGGVLTNRLGAILARIKVIAQYSYKTADGDYELADHSHKIGTITAYCERVPRNKCPDAVNET